MLSRRLLGRSEPRTRASARTHARPPARRLPAFEGERVYSRTNRESPEPRQCARRCRACQPGPACVSVCVFPCAVRGTGVAYAPRVCTRSSRRKKKRRRVRYAVRSHRRSRHRHRHREPLRDELRRARESCARRDGHARRGERSPKRRARPVHHARRRARENRAETTASERARVNGLNAAELALRD